MLDSFQCIRLFGSFRHQGCHRVDQPRLLVGGHEHFIPPHGDGNVRCNHAAEDDGRLSLPSLGLGLGLGLEDCHQGNDDEQESHGHQPTTGMDEKHHGTGGRRKSRSPCPLGHALFSRQSRLPGRFTFQMRKTEDTIPKPEGPIRFQDGARTPSSSSSR